MKSDEIFPLDANAVCRFPHGRGWTWGALMGCSVALLDEIMSMGADFPSFDFYDFLCSPILGILVASLAVRFSLPYPLLYATAAFLVWLVAFRVFVVIPDDWHELRNECPGDRTGNDYVAEDALILSRVFGVKDVCTSDKAFLVIDAVVLTALVPAVVFFWRMAQAAVTVHETSQDYHSLGTNDCLQTRI